MNDRSEYAPKTGGRTPTHDQICTFDPNLCRDCKLQAEARADEREQIAARIQDYNLVGQMQSDFIAKGVRWIALSHALEAIRGGEQA